MSAKRYPRKITVVKTEVSTSNLYLRRKSGEADNNAVANSGCMRGNDTYGKNGSGSVGVIPLEEEKDPRQMTYNEFIHHNYGPVSQRQYP